MCVSFLHVDILHTDRKMREEQDVSKEHCRQKQPMSCSKVFYIFLNVV